MTQQLDNYKFDGQRSDEVIIILFRKHGIVCFLKILSRILIVGLLALGGSFLLHKYSVQIKISALFISFLWTIYYYGLWYYTFFILTNQRLRCIQRNGLFKQSMLDIPINSISSVFYQSSSLLADLMGYSNLKIDFANGELDMIKIKSGNKVYNLIQDLINKGNVLNDEPSQKK